MNAFNRNARAGALGLALLCAAAVPSLASAQAAGSFSFDFSNVASYGELGDADNTTFSFNLGANTLITGFSWDVDVTAYDPSWLSELMLQFSKSNGEGVQFWAVETDAPGTATSSGYVDLVNSGLGFRLGSDGLLRLEFFEAYDDLPGLADGRWNSGSFRFDYVAVVPEPASYALFGAGLLAVAALTRRRR